MSRYAVDKSKVVLEIKRLINRGNVTRLKVTSESGKILVNIPVSVVGLAAFGAPFWIGLVAILAFVKKCHFEVTTEN